MLIAAAHAQVASCPALTVIQETYIAEFSNVG